MIRVFYTLMIFLKSSSPKCKISKELVLDFGISKYDRRKFSFLMEYIPSPCRRGLNYDLKTTIFQCSKITEV